jgi:hypothetical protein
VVEDHISLWALARRLRTYPELLRALARFFDVPTVGRGQSQCVTAADAQVLADLLWCRRAIPTVAQMLGKPRRRRRRRR